MKKTSILIPTLALLSACAGGSGSKPVNDGSAVGVITDATMHTVTIVTAVNDTLRFTTEGADKQLPNGLLLDDTLEVTFDGAYTPGMQALTMVSHPVTPLVGGDRDEHGCIGSAGYVWSEVLKDCVRLWEVGIRTEAIDGSGRSAFLVFAPDSAQVELFFSEDAPREVLDRRVLPSGGAVWNVEDDDTKNVRRVNGLWTISRRGELLFRE